MSDPLDQEAEMAAEEKFPRRASTPDERRENEMCRWAFLDGIRWKSNRESEVRARAFEEAANLTVPRSMKSKSGARYVQNACHDYDMKRALLKLAEEARKR